MSRPSAASLAVIIPGTSRPEPPDDLNDEEQATWRGITGQMPSNWFPPETWPMLSQLCVHIRQAKVLAAASRKIDPRKLATEAGQERYNQLMRMVEREGRAISSLSTRLRLTPQSRYDSTKASSRTREVSGITKPWDIKKTA